MYMGNSKSIEKVESNKKSNKEKSSKKLNEVEKKNETWGIISLVSGILSFFIPFFGFLLAIFAIIAYFIQRKIGDSIFGIIGLIFGIISIILTVVIFLFMILFGVFIMGLGMML